MINSKAIGGIVTFIAVVVTMIQDIGGVRHSLAMTIGWYGKKLTYAHDSEVFYTNKVTEAEAKKFGDLLAKEGWFDKDRKSLQLTKDKAGTYEVRVVAIEDIKTKIPNYVEVFKEFDKEISKAVFEGKPVKTDLCDKYFSTIEVIE
jgi:nitric oxide synthase oxygenase domain/subunit